MKFASDDKTQQPLLDQDGVEDSAISTNIIIKNWVRAMSFYVIRHENLKKFQVVKELGQGGQGKVYKIIYRKQN